MIDTIVLHFGYVESARLATIICTHDNGGFSSKEEAIKDLAADLLARFKENLPRASSCCKKNSKNEANYFCSICGKRLGLEFDPLAFQQWIVDLLTYDLDSFGYSESVDDRELYWTIGCSPMHLVNADDSTIYCIEESADRVLLESLGLEHE